MSANIFENCEHIVPANYLQIALSQKAQKDAVISELLRKRKIPENGWPDDLIESFVRDLAALDTNNVLDKAGVGEREGRIACSLVARRHYSFGHGIGRSGDLLESQPKAAGSTLLSNLTNSLLLDLVHIMGVRSCQFCFLVPMATGMTITLSLLYLRKQRPEARYVLWSRIDQKSCLKCITTAGFVPIPIDPILNDDFSLSTNLGAFEEQLNSLSSEQVVCILSTTSCFAPRNCDSIQELAEIAKRFDVPHIVNNAYGLQSYAITHRLEQACRCGRVDLFVQSTDKNLMVPVGGSIIAGPDEAVVRQVAKTYAGRASSSQSLDVLMTLLSLGKQGYLSHVRRRKELYNYLLLQLKEFSSEYGTSVIQAKDNPFSLAVRLEHAASEELPRRHGVSFVGSMLFTRGVSGVRVVHIGDDKVIDGVHIRNWGAHHSSFPFAYLTASAAIGLTQQEVDKFMRKLRECWRRYFKRDALPLTADDK